VEIKEKIKTSVETYRQAPGINYSGLSKLAYSPLLYKKNLDNPEDKKSTSAMNLGSCVDILLTDENSFYDNFYIMTAHKPDSEMMCKYIETLVGTNNHEEAYIVSGYKLSADKVKEKYLKEGSNYHEALTLSKDKIILTFNEFSQCKEVVSAIKNKFPQYFNKEENIDIYYQVAILWKYENTDCKSLLDIIEVNHNTKTIQPIDIKTTSKSILEFSQSYEYWKYYLQASFYSKSLYWAKANSIFRDCSNYTILPFQFLVAEMANIHPPYLFNVSSFDLIRGEFGGKNKNGDRIKGFAELIKDLKWHIQTDNWCYPYEYYNNEFNLNIFV